jgi:hypothetical protein
MFGTNVPLNMGKRLISKTARIGSQRSWQRWYFLVYLVSSKNDERFSPDWQSGANVREMHGVPSRLWIQELTMEGRMDI